MTATDVELAEVIAGELVLHGDIRPTEAMRLAGLQVAVLRQLGALTSPVPGVDQLQEIADATGYVPGRPGHDLVEHVRNLRSEDRELHRAYLELKSQRNT